jgi:hypothetical protein
MNKKYVLKRHLQSGFPMGSAGDLIASGAIRLPYRVEICGAFLDHPFVSKTQPGCVIAASIAPTEHFFTRGGLATSTRTCLYEVAKNHIHCPDPEQLAKLVFRYENGIDKIDHPVAGAEDAIGICMPGLTYQYYSGTYWPDKVVSLLNPEILHWVENTITLYPLWQRGESFNPLVGMCVTKDAAHAMAAASESCWEAINTMNTNLFADSVNHFRVAQRKILPAMFPPEVFDAVKEVEAKSLAWKFTGCGGGGYLIVVGATDLPGTLPIQIRTETSLF